VQIDSESKIIYVHIPRTGGSWFSFAWNSNRNVGDILQKANCLWNKLNDKKTPCGRHGTLSGILEKIKKIEYDVSDFKIVTTVREPVDRAVSSWVWFSKVKLTAKKHGWKTIDDMLDEYESGTVRSNYMPQVFWLEEKNAKFDYVYRFEDLLQGSKIVNKDFPLFNRGYKNKNRLRRGRDTVVERKKLNSKQIQRIKDIYKEDVRYLDTLEKNLK
jgi:hypothetical protein